MAHRPCFSSWSLVCWLVVAVAEGQEEVVIPPGGSQHINPTDCQIFTLTPPPTTRNPTTRVQPITRTPKYPFSRITPRRPRIYPGFQNRHVLPPRCNHRFHFQPFPWPHSRLNSRRYFLGRNLPSESSSEESREKREAKIY
ncbi:hypothetical protein H1C71_037021 [Ictidomys tridecemlineatus]|uniref:odontogenesis associated phosphoprotein n=1 Tax=Ictidomys tridecemlineatus TaxID=43179 RepID=UPI00038BBC51|nr:odontogenesis associated phosphoprotein [Ictidomys tridecemlineatus]KAG3276416.1 hypothetical protein H1C71_037021 [Ictidomys tridecemlineatus]